MKKILLSMMLICAFTIVNAQVICGGGAIKRWDGSGTPGDQGTGQAGTPTTLFVINGSSADWIQHITGPYAYATVNKGGFEPDPHTASVSPANVQLDGLRSALAPNYDMDVPGQDHRDLRYFAFTYDRANVFFYFRRPKNNTAQVSLYYFIDINVDGYMKTGEPVIKVTFNNSGSDIEMGWYEAVNSNGLAAGSYDATLGNRMSATTVRAKNIPNTSEWAVGAADGWNMPGDFHLISTASLPALTVTNGIQEVFAAQTLTDAHPDGNEPGYGVEFAVPFRYIGLYTAAGLTGGTAINYSNVFTWHVSLGSGNSGISGAEDNAGGCCSGLAVSGLPDVDGTPSFTSSSLYDFRYRITYLENRNLNSSITTGRLTVKNPKDANGAVIPAASVAAWSVIGYKDANCDNTAEGAGVTFNFNASLSYPTVPEDGGGNRFYVFTPSVPTDTKIDVAGNGTVCYYLDINTVTGGWPPLKSAAVSFLSVTEFNLGTLVCNPDPIGGVTEELTVLPVKLVYFNAARSGSNVNLTWQTSIEENSKGFDIQRFTGSASGWQTIGFIPTQAVNGNSSTALNYQFTDFNNTTKGITQYRLKQVDKDNRSSYSLIRSVRGDGQKGKTIVYPNPSSDGKVSIIFEDVNGPRDISVMDVSGRVVKQMKGVTNNNIVIENLNAGFYTVRIVNIETGDQTVEKFVVNKR